MGKPGVANREVQQGVGGEVIHYSSYDDFEWGEPIYQTWVKVVLIESNVVSKVLGVLDRTNVKYQSMEKEKNN